MEKEANIWRRQIFGPRRRRKWEKDKEENFWSRKVFGLPRRKRETMRRRKIYVKRKYFLFVKKKNGGGEEVNNFENDNQWWLQPTVNNQPFIEKTIEGRDLQQLTHLRDYKYHSLRKCDTQHWPWFDLDWPLWRFLGGIGKILVANSLSSLTQNFRQQPDFREDLSDIQKLWNR